MVLPWVIIHGKVLDNNVGKTVSTLPTAFSWVMSYQRGKMPRICAVYSVGKSPVLMVKPWVMTKMAMGID
jgi:hypothetical protein